MDLFPTSVFKLKLVDGGQVFGTQCYVRYAIQFLVQVAFWLILVRSVQTWCNTLNSLIVNVDNLFPREDYLTKVRECSVRELYASVWYASVWYATLFCGTQYNSQEDQDILTWRLLEEDQVGCLIHSLIHLFIFTVHA